jgi:integrase/recombinase XerD
MKRAREDRTTRGTIRRHVRQIHCGADVRHAQAILGHKKLETTALYTRVVIEDLRQVVSRGHPRERARRGPRGRYNRFEASP